MSYWHTAARLLRQAKRDLEETESGLSEEVLTAGAAHRHWRVVAEDTRDALREAQNAGLMFRSPYRRPNPCSRLEIQGRSCQVKRCVPMLPTWS